MRVLALAGLLAACGDNTTREDRQGGDLTIDDRTRDAFTYPLPTLDARQLERHSLGHGPVAFMWTPPELGPLFNHTACLGCHPRNGRGLSQIGPSPFGSQALIRVSLETGTPDVPGGPVPVPGYGTQLQDHAIRELPEVNVALTWVEVEERYGDGTTYTLRAPRLDITTPGGGPLSPDIRISYRQAPPLVGLGLLEAIDEADLAALEDPDDADGDGISGRLNRVWDSLRKVERAGRFGHKASVASLLEQTAGAFANDMGLTNKLFPELDGRRDVNDAQLDDSAFFIATIAVPAAAPRSEAAARGRDRFDTFGCAACHTPTHVTARTTDIPQLASQLIHPYTDLLLHDVGDLLTDARRDFLAEGVEWRTPPLWGIGLTKVVLPDATFLHDGRARTLAEAILSHGGEARAAREAFRTASLADRDALISFLETL